MVIHRHRHHLTVFRRSPGDPEPPAAGSSDQTLSLHQRPSPASDENLLPTIALQTSSNTLSASTFTSPSTPSPSTTLSTKTKRPHNKGPSSRRAVSSTGSTAALATSNSLGAGHSPQTHIGHPPTLSLTALIAIVAGASVLGLLIIASGVWYCVKRRKLKREENLYWGVRPNGKPSSIDGRLLASAQAQRVLDEKDVSISEGSYELEKRSTATNSALTRTVPQDRDSEKAGARGSSSDTPWNVSLSSGSQRRKAATQERLWNPPSTKEEQERKEREKLRLTLAAMDFGPDVKSSTTDFQNFAGIDEAAGVNGMGPNGWERSQGRAVPAQPRLERRQSEFKPGETKVALSDGFAKPDAIPVESVSTARLLNGRREDAIETLGGKSRKTDTIAGFVDAYGSDDDMAPPLPATTTKKPSLVRRHATPLFRPAIGTTPCPPSEASTEYSVSEAHTVLGDSAIPAGWLQRSGSGMSMTMNGKRKAPPTPLDLSEHDQAERDLEDILQQLDPRLKRLSPGKAKETATSNARSSLKGLAPVPNTQSPPESATQMPSENSQSPTALSATSSAHGKLPNPMTSLAVASTLRGKLKELDASDQEVSKSYGSVAPGRLALGRGESVYSYRVEEVGEYSNSSSTGTPSASPCTEGFPIVPPIRTNVQAKGKDVNAKKRASSFYGLSYARESVDNTLPALPCPPPLSPFTTSPLVSPGLAPTMLQGSNRNMGAMTPNYARSSFANSGSLRPAEISNVSLSREASLQGTSDMFTDIGSALLNATSPSSRTDWTFGSSAPPSPGPATPDMSNAPSNYSRNRPLVSTVGMGKRERIGPQDVDKAGFTPLEAMKVPHVNETGRDSVYGMYDYYLSSSPPPLPPSSRSAMR